MVVNFETLALSTILLLHANLIEKLLQAVLLLKLMDDLGVVFVERFHAVGVHDVHRAVPVRIL